MTDIEKLVDLILEFETEDPLEIEALQILIGGKTMYDSIMVFKDVRDVISKAINFINKLNDKFEVNDLF